MRISGKAKQLSWDSHREWPSLPIYNLISAWACGNEEADFQRPTQGWTRFSTSSEFTFFETQPTDKDDMSLSYKPGLLSEQVSQLMITLVVFDKWVLEDHHSACALPLYWGSEALWHTSQRWPSIEFKSCPVKRPIHSRMNTTKQFWELPCQ